jgi:hypothetical protein
MTLTDVALLLIVLVALALQTGSLYFSYVTSKHIGVLYRLFKMMGITQAWTFFVAGIGVLVIRSLAVVVDAVGFGNWSIDWIFEVILLAASALLFVGTYKMLRLFAKRF